MSGNTQKIPHVCLVPPIPLLAGMQFDNSILFCVDLAPLLVLVSLELSVKESG